MKVGLAKGAFKSNAPCVAVETGLLTSLILSTLPRPTSELFKVTAPVLPLTLVTVSVGVAKSV